MADWSQLPEELLHAISERLESPLYLLRFRSVCSSWRSSSAPIPKHHIRLPHPVPSSSVPFYLSRRTLVLINIPRHQGDAFYPCDPWLPKITHDPLGQTQVLHPLAHSPYKKSHPRLALPKALDIYRRPVFHLGHEFALTINFIIPHITKVVFASLGSSGFALLTINANGELILFRTGDEAWTIIPYMPANRFDDLCVIKGRLCAVEDTGRTVVVGLDSRVVLLVAELGFGGGDKKYLVDCNGELLLVDIHYEIFYRSKRVKMINVFRVDEEEKKWVELKSLGDWVLFLGEDSSFSLSASDLFVGRGNCVIFNDKTLKHEIGVFQLDERIIRDISSYSDYYRLFWPDQFTY